MLKSIILVSIALIFLYNGVAVFGEQNCPDPAVKNITVYYKVPISTNDLSFCSQVNYTVLLQANFQSIYTANRVFTWPAVELPSNVSVETNCTYWNTYTHSSSYNFTEIELDAQGRNGGQLALNLSVIDQEASKTYDTVVNVLKRYNCRDFYPYLSCNQCITAYKNWVCAVMFPKTGYVNVSAPVDASKPPEASKLCEDVCFEVVRKCPVELNFHCPLNDNTLGTNLTTCNSLGYTPPTASSGTSLTIHSLYSMLILIVAGLLFV